MSVRERVGLEDRENLSIGYRRIKTASADVRVLLIGVEV